MKQSIGQGSTMKQFVTYRRVSTKDQGTTGHGQDAQQRDIDLYLSTYADVPFEVIGGFSDVQSGKDNDRPELVKALDLCRKSGATLLVSKLDRLSRRVSFIAKLMEDTKLSLRVASMPNADKFQLHIYAALAEQERDFISLRTKAALSAAKAKGVTLGGLRDKTARRNEAIQRNAAAFAGKVSGIVQPLRGAGKSLREIAAALDASGVETARGGKWSAAQVLRVLERLTPAPA
jgi:DNA invertase Pin-like site-specific DNA recombinase